MDAMCAVQGCGTGVSQSAGQIEEGYAGVGDGSLYRFATPVSMGNSKRIIL
jgi:hypothetical protein